MNTLTYTFAYSYLKEDEGEINGQSDPTAGFKKQSVAATIAFATMDRDWVVKATWSHALKDDNWGQNFPTTDIFSLGVSHVLR